MFFTCRTLRVGARFLLRTAVAAEKGTQLVEAAFVLPILLMLLLGIIWTGRGYMVYETITRAAREGSSSACLDKSSATFQNYIKPALQATNLDANRVTNYCQKTQWLNTGDDPQSCGVVISFTYPTEMAVPFTSLNMTTINISTQVQMRNENQPASLAGAAPTCP